MNRKSQEKMTPVITITVVQERSGVQIHCSYNGFQKSNAANVATQMLAANELYRDLHEAAGEMCIPCWEANGMNTDSDDFGKSCLFPKSECFVKQWLETLKKANDPAGTVPAGNITSTERRDHEG